MREVIWFLSIHKALHNGKTNYVNANNNLYLLQQNYGKILLLLKLNLLQKSITAREKKLLEFWILRNLRLESEF